MIQYTEHWAKQLQMCCRSVRDERVPGSIRLTETGVDRRSPYVPQRHLVLIRQSADASHLHTLLASRSAVFSSSAPSLFVCFFLSFFRSSFLSLFLSFFLSFFLFVFSCSRICVST